MSNITKPMVLNETVQALNGKLDTMNAFLESIATSLEPSPTPTPSVGGAEKDVNFYDYDGTLVTSYTAEEFLELSEMPTNPTHNGLTAQGWNWTLEDAQSYVEDNGMLDIGQNYVTSDGKTRIYIHLDAGRLSIQLNFKVHGTCVIDWGDERSDSVTNDEGSYYYPCSVNSTHVYESAGDYVITLDVTNANCIAFGDDDDHEYAIISKWDDNEYNRETSNANWGFCNSIKKIELGSKYYELLDYAFIGCRSMESITIPNTVYDAGYSSPFDFCYNLKCVVIPDAVPFEDWSEGGAEPVIYNYKTTNIDFELCDCRSLKYLLLPKSVTSINLESSTTSIEKVILPPDIEEFSYSTDDYVASQLKTVIIPEGVEIIPQEAFYGCGKLSHVKIPSTLTSIYDAAFCACQSLSSIELPETISYIGEYAFMSSGIESFTIPPLVTYISSGTFSYCDILTTINIHENVTTIDTQAFNYCHSLGGIIFAGDTPPTVDSSDTFDELPTDCVLHVPNNSYTYAENYPDPSVYVYDYSINPK
jgi:hypothetical protein